MKKNTHISIRENMLFRIQSGEWGLGEKIPTEIKLAEEYGCARATINRSLQALADDGLLVRKRKGGTRVNKFPVRQAKLEIPIIREQIEVTGSQYRHELLAKTVTNPPTSILSRLRITNEDMALHLETLHLADERPFAFEERWVNTKAVPGILDAPLETISANEWLIKKVPFSKGDVIFSAISANKKVSEAMDVSVGASIFTIRRTTWFDKEYITTMKLYYKEGYELISQI